MVRAGASFGRASHREAVLCDVEDSGCLDDAQLRSLTQLAGSLEHDYVANSGPLVDSLWPCPCEVEGSLRLTHAFLAWQ